jgi:AcrR family transcriptional regulator
MQSLRERQKLQRRVDMLVAARSLFVEHGYTRTTMDAIAERAGVGVATVYTYFATKEGVFAELARMDMSELKAEAEATLEPGIDDPVDAVITLLNVYVKVHEYISYEVIRDFSISARTQGPIRDVAVWVHDWQREHIETVLRQAQRAGSLAPRLAVRDAALIICDLLDRYYERARSQETHHRALETLTRCVALLFTDWRAVGKNLD